MGGINCGTNVHGPPRMHTYICSSLLESTWSGVVGGKPSILFCANGHAGYSLNICGVSEYVTRGRDQNQF